MCICYTEALRQGRVNGAFHPDGAFHVLDAEDVEVARVLSVPGVGPRWSHMAYEGGYRPRKHTHTAMRIPC